MHTEIITIDGVEAATIVSAATSPPPTTTFITKPESTQQVGYIVYPKGGRVQPHYHLPIERNFRGTSEVIFVISGSCLVRFYDQQQKERHSAVLKAGDAIIIGNCGHGFDMLEDTVLFEVKQGPYIGLEEKCRF
jgi:cupin fold WbuC family metalloprotein